MRIEKIQIDKLNPAPYNPRKNLKPGDAEYEHIKNSIDTFGYIDPIIWNSRTGNIVGGHQRFKILKAQGVKEIECVVVDYDETTEKAANASLNKAQGDWDIAKLDELLTDLSPLIDMGQFGFEINLPQDAAEDDFDADKALEEVEEPVTKLGDIWTLGRHRLMCGDSTDNNTAATLMGGIKADVVFTDPPYKIETEGGCKGSIGKSLKKQGSDIRFIAGFEPNAFLKVLPTMFDKNKMNAYVFCNKELLVDYLLWARDSQISFNVLVWKKPNGIPIGDSHRPDIEYLLLFRKNAIWNNGIKNVNYSRCLEYGRERGLHPTMKPIELIANELQISSNAGSVVCDLFGGSGSTLVACEQLNRTCYMMELDPKYCDVIIKRWETLSGQKAVLNA